MTSTEDMAEHPDVAEISDLTEGLLSPVRSADVRRHLDECAFCADIRASLKEIRDLLGTAPGPTRMPAEVAGRIDAALAAEALLGATTSEPEADRDPTPPAASDVGPAHVSRETSMLSHRPTRRPRSSTTGPGRKIRLPGGRRRAAVLGAVLTVAALGLGSVVVASWNVDTGPDGGHPTTAADTFSERNLQQQVTDLLARSNGESKSSKSSKSPRTFGLESESGAANPRVLRTPSVPECVREGIGRTDAALATEQGTFQGEEALLVVLPDTSDDTRVTAYVVEATCVSNPSSSATAEVLMKHSYTR
ncbi:membrane protein [Streptomyces toyocaensis]|uniref:Membrane protein n=1 Tax=Streptomyces toyocaensis TaxID=55952 RepID=A0A081XPA6_STRTO|nr:membrane protein [Streptomyces toyocaensis]KES05379.1 membrane protein [Streptomyces toyocaensis]